MVGGKAWAATATRADENGIRFWIPGFFGSLAATPQQPGWSVAAFNYFTDVSGGGNIAVDTLPTYYPERGLAATDQAISNRPGRLLLRSAHLRQRLRSDAVPLRVRVSLASIRKSDSFFPWPGCRAI